MQNLIADTKHAIAEYEQAAGALDWGILTAGFVIKLQDIFLTFDIDVAGHLSNARPCQPHKARSFSLNNAELVACMVTNGNGKRGKIVHVRQAINEALAVQRDMLVAFEAYQQQNQETIV